MKLSIDSEAKMIVHTYMYFIISCIDQSKYMIIFTTNFVPTDISQDSNLRIYKIKNKKIEIFETVYKLIKN